MGAQRIAKAFLGRQVRIGGNNTGTPSQRFHAHDTHIFSPAHRHDLMLEASLVSVHNIDRHLRGIPVIRLAQHLQVGAWFLWPVKPTYRTLPAFLASMAALIPPFSNTQSGSLS